MDTSQGLLAWLILVSVCAGCSPSEPTPEPATVRILAERVERVDRDEVHLTVRMVNGSARPVFMLGIDYEKHGNGKPRPYPLFLEQWRETGWKTLLPCLDTLPSDVLKMNPGDAVTLDYVLTLPLSAVCRERDFRLEGMFRYRLDYFESEKQARAYAREVYWEGRPMPQLGPALSEPFEISSVKE